jgi:hypothetical protein
LLPDSPLQLNDPPEAKKFWLLVSLAGNSRSPFWKAKQVLMFCFLAENKTRLAAGGASRSKPKGLWWARKESNLQPPD